MSGVPVFSIVSVQAAKFVHAPWRSMSPAGVLTRCPAVKSASKVVHFVATLLGITDIIISRKKFTLHCFALPWAHETQHVHTYITVGWDLISTTL